MRHGGDLSIFGAGGGWLDLSTGINPVPYPVQALPPGALTRLPQASRLATLLETARRAYGVAPNATIVAAPGTQLVIQLLPFVRCARSVAIVGPTYSEHAIGWARAGAAVAEVADLDAVSAGDVGVIVNPNNPDGRRWPREHILSAAGEMSERGGLLVVDESFADVAPELSVASHAGDAGLVVLRSFGKFFGLAGVRLGFAIGSQDVVGAMEQLMGPWAVSGPAVEYGIAALADEAWIAHAREMCRRQALALDAVLVRAGLEVIGGTDLFRLARCENARGLHQALLGERILTRTFDDAPDWMRFGLPATDADLQRLSRALNAYREGVHGSRTSPPAAATRTLST
jgi:cobalamin biosynthetic protein CobC